MSKMVQDKATGLISIEHQYRKSYTIYRMVSFSNHLE